MSRCLFAVLLGLVAVANVAADPPRLTDLRTQQVGDATYFHATFSPPDDLDLPFAANLATKTVEWTRRRLATLPRLVAQDGNHAEIYYHHQALAPQKVAQIRVILPEPNGAIWFDGTFTQSTGKDRLFHTPPLTPGRSYRYKIVGTWDTPAKAIREERMIFVIPDETTIVDFTKPADKREPALPAQEPSAQLEFYGRVVGELPKDYLLIYPQKVAKDPLRKSEPFAGPVLELQPTAEAKVKADFAAGRDVPRVKDAVPTLEHLWAHAKVRQFAIMELLTPEFGYYSVASDLTAREYDIWRGGPPRLPPVEITRARLYDMTTGAAAITESLARERMLQGRPEPRSERKIDVALLPGIDIAEHPWKKMMAGKKPLPEPLAKLVPHDNYYVTFHNLDAFLAFGELADQWGGNVMHAVQVHSRDYHVRERYEEQLCLPSGKAIHKIVPQALLKQFTSDLIVDMAITGSDLNFKEGTDVSVIFHVKDKKQFLATFDLFIDAARKKHGKHLIADRSRYLGVEIENFTTELREVSLHRAAVGDFVIYANSPIALERILNTRGKLYKSLADSLDFQYMRTVFPRDAKEEDGFAFLSDAFIRQLVGPVAKIKTKRRYEALTSLQLATHAALFVGAETGKLPAGSMELMKISGLRGDELDVPEGPRVAWHGNRRLAVSPMYNTLHFTTPIIELPLDKVTPSEARDYAEFRREYMGLWRQFFDPVGLRLKLNDKQVKLEAYILPLVATTQYNQLRQYIGGPGTKFNWSLRGPNTAVQLFANVQTSGWATLWVDDSPLFRQLVEKRILNELGSHQVNVLDENNAHARQLIRELPWTVGIGGKEADKLAGVANLLWNAVRDKLELENKSRTAWIDGNYYITMQEDSLKRLRDLEKNKKARQGDDSEPLNMSLCFAPSTKKTANAIQLHFEWESHKQALGNNAVWLALEHAAVLDPAATDDLRRRAARMFLGYTPISPDGSAYHYDRQRDAVNNLRHGSFERERLHAGLDDASPLRGLLQQLQSVRADLRFREDGIHTILTIERGK